MKFIIHIYEQHKLKHRKKYYDKLWIKSKSYSQQNGSPVLV